MRLLVYTFVLFLTCSTFASEQILTRCKVTNYTYVHVEPFNDEKVIFKPKPTKFVTKKESSGEEYWLTYDPSLPLKYNIYYKTKDLPDNDWDVVNDTIKKGSKYFIFNDNPRNLVLTNIYLGFQKQTYHFNLDHNHNGFLILTNVRWNSLMNAMNNSSLYFCECKGATK